jgi:hypothetical protein
MDPDIPTRPLIVAVPIANTQPAMFLHEEVEDGSRARDTDTRLSKFPA